MGERYPWEPTCQHVRASMQTRLLGKLPQLNEQDGKRQLAQYTSHSSGTFTNAAPRSAVNQGKTE